MRWQRTEPGTLLPAEAHIDRDAASLAQEYGQMDEAAGKRLKALEKENTELKKMYAEAILGRQAVARRGCSQPQTCRFFRLHVRRLQRGCAERFVERNYTREGAHSSRDATDAFLRLLGRR